jgi:Cu-processing system permease protein
MDVSALMGYTGAVFKDFFGSLFGSVIVTIILLLWIIIPIWISTKKFQKKDL